MQRRVTCFLGLLILLFLGSTSVLGVESNFCPDLFRGDQTVLDLPQEEVYTPEKGLVPRNQVLLEIATGTW